MTPRFLMQPVFHKFLKFRKFCKTFKETKVYGWSRQKKSKKTKDTASGAVNASHSTQIWPAVKLFNLNIQLKLFNLNIHFNIHPPTFSMDGRFPFYYVQGSFPMQNFSHFHPTLAEPFSDQAGPSGILTYRPDSPASVVTDSDSPTRSRSSEGLQEMQKKQYDKWLNTNST